MSHDRDGLTKKSSTPACGKYKNRCLCNSAMQKVDNEGKPQKNASFGFFVYFLQLLILEREGLYISIFSNVPISVVHGENG